MSINYNSPDSQSKTCTANAAMWQKPKAIALPSAGALRAAKAILGKHSCVTDRAVHLAEIIDQESGLSDLLDALKKCKAAVENGALPPSARMELVRDYATPIIVNSNH